MLNFFKNKNNNNYKNNNTNNNSSDKSYVFLKSDIVVYCFLVIIITLLFVFCVILPKSTVHKGFNLSVKGKTIVTVEFSNQTPKIDKDSIGLVKVENSENGFLITVYFNQELTSFNRIYIDLANKSAKVIESTCSVSKDCVHSPEISSNGAIICAPHSLKVSPIGENGFSEPVVG